MFPGDLEAVGACLNENWVHKKLMAHGCEPAVCRQIMDQLHPHVFGKFALVLCTT